MKNLDRLKEAELVDPILIYQMGKVGSSSVYASLTKAGLPNAVFHVHQLSDAGIKKKEAWLNYLQAIQNPGIADGLTYTRKFKEFFETNRSKHKWNVVSLTREPVILEVSAFFHNINTIYAWALDESGKPDKGKIIAHFDRYFNAESPTPQSYLLKSNYFLNWFDNELKTVFGFDVYSQPFDFSKGYATYKTDNLNVLIIRLEDINRVFSEAMQAFLGLDGIELIALNRSDDMAYGELYQEVLGEISVSAALCEGIYSSKYASHFYSEEERDGFRKKWQRDGLGPRPGCSGDS